MEFVTRTAMADAVLALLKLKIEKTNPDDEGLPARHIDVYPYRNGRECGWALVCKTNVVVFAEHRNAGKLVIYSGTRLDFDLNLIPNKNAYEQGERGLFRSTSLELATSSIYKLLFS